MAFTLNGKNFTGGELNGKKLISVHLGDQLQWLGVADPTLVDNFKIRVLADGGTFENEIAIRAFSQTLSISNTTLALFPSSYKAGKIYSLIGNDASITRATQKTRVDKDLQLETLANNVNAPDYTTGAGRLLAGAQTTNEFLHSENLANGAWQKTSLNATANKLIPTVGTGVRLILQQLTAPINQSYVFSFYAKKAEFRFVQIVMDSTGFGGSPDWFNFDLETGTFGSGAINNITDRGFELMADGYYRIYVVKKTTSAGNARAVFTVVNSATSARLEATTGNGSDGVFVTNLQMTKGDKLTSYIPTTTSMVTKNADVITVNPPIGTNKITETLDSGVINIITTIPTTYQVPFERYKSIVMTKL